MRRHVRVVDDKGRAQATGKRKTSIARVWVWPGQGEGPRARSESGALSTTSMPISSTTSHHPHTPRPTQGT